MNEIVVPTVIVEPNKVINPVGLTVGEAIEELLQLDPNLKIATIDNEYGIQYDVEVCVDKLQDYEMSQWQRDEWGVKTGDKIVYIR